MRLQNTMLLSNKFDKIKINSNAADYLAMLNFYAKFRSLILMDNL